ncbi:MAG: FCD domain-containing protein [Ornithinimicrobium sp.]
MNAVPAPRLAPVRFGNVFEETMEALLQEIRLGQLAPGEKLLPERELAEALGVSRTTLREVLAHLSKNGYVTVRRGRYGGTYVAAPVPPLRPSPISEGGWDEASDVLTLRRVVEPAAAELAARRGVSGAQAEQLWQAHRDCCSASAAHYRPLDSRLHLLVADLSGSPRLRAVVAESRAGVNALLDCIPLLPPNLAHSAVQHEAVVRAIVDAEPEAARAAMLDHVDGTAALLRGFLK